MTTASVVIGSPKEYTPLQDNMVEVVIKYPKDWAKEKFFTDGDIKSVSLETAEQFAELGIIETIETGELIVPVLVEVPVIAEKGIVTEPVLVEVKPDKKAK